MPLSCLPLPDLEVMEAVLSLQANEALVHPELLHRGRVDLRPTNAFQPHLSPSSISWCLRRHSGVRWPCIAWQSNKFGFVQCSHPMNPNGMLYLTRVSPPPYPFVSTGTLTISTTDEKTTFFRKLSLYPQVIGVATRPKDMNILIGSSRKVRWTGNRTMGAGLRPVCARIGAWKSLF